IRDRFGHAPLRQPHAAPVMIQIPGGNSAVELSGHPQGGIPTWDLYHHRGRVRLAQGRVAEAVADLRIAVRLGRDWRWSTPAEDSTRMGAGVWLEQVHSALVDAGNRLYLENRDPAL